jgi:tRNA nucleotidyltransferase (CCA-adding enzyme)
MLRAVRLEQRLGFAIGDRTLELMHQALPLLDRVSGERIRNELDLIFVEPRRTEIMTRLQNLGLLRAIHPALSWDDWLAQGFEAIEVFTPPEAWRLHGPVDRELLRYALLMIRLAGTESDTVLARLHFPAGRRDVVMEANEVARHVAHWSGDESPSRVSGILSKIHETAIVTAWLAAADRPMVQASLSNYLADWRWISPAVDGTALRDLGLAPGPIYGEILGRLRDARLDGEIKTDGEERALLQRLVEKAASGG